MPDVRLQLIGGFDLTVDGRPVDSLQPGMQRLLAFVALTPRGVGREFAALQLWPDTSEDRARANLRSALWRIRRLPVDLLTTTGARLRLSEAVWVDARHGINGLARGDAGLVEGLPFRSLLVDLLPDWYDDWLDIERERLRQLSLSGLERCAADALGAGDVSTAIQLALTAASIDPLRESAHRLLIEAHLAEGNQRDAVRALDDYRRRAALESLAPSADLEALVGRRVAGWSVPLRATG